MNYEKILCEFQNFIKAYLSLEHKQHRILDLNLSEVHLLKVAEQNPSKRKIASTLTFLGGCFAATDI